MRLQSEGSIKYSRGALTIVDRSQLELSACECYRMMKARTTIQGFDQVAARTSIRN